MVVIFYRRVKEIPKKMDYLGGDYGKDMIGEEEGKWKHLTSSRAVNNGHVFFPFRR